MSSALDAIALLNESPKGGQSHISSQHERGGDGTMPTPDMALHDVEVRTDPGAVHPFSTHDSDEAQEEITGKMKGSGWPQLSYEGDPARAISTLQYEVERILAIVGAIADEQEKVQHAVEDLVVRVGAMQEMQGGHDTVLGEIIKALVAIRTSVLKVERNTSSLSGARVVSEPPAPTVGKVEKGKQVAIGERPDTLAAASARGKEAIDSKALRDELLKKREARKKAAGNTRSTQQLGA